MEVNTSVFHFKLSIQDETVSNVINFRVLFFEIFKTKKFFPPLEIKISVFWESCNSQYALI